MKSIIPSKNKVVNSLRQKSLKMCMCPITDNQIHEAIVDKREKVSKSILICEDFLKPVILLLCQS